MDRQRRESFAMCIIDSDACDVFCTRGGQAHASQVPNMHSASRPPMGPTPRMNQQCTGTGICDSISHNDTADENVRREPVHGTRLPTNAFKQIRRDLSAFPVVYISRITRFLPALHGKMQPG